MGLNDYFDKIYCINLDEATERLASCEEQAEKFEFKFERFPAIKPKDGINTLLKGEYGILLSNLEIVKDAYKNNYKNILILEDDFEFVENFNGRFKEGIEMLPNDWDMLFFGGNHIHHPKLINTYFSKLYHTYAIHTIGINHSIFEQIIEVLPKAKKQVDVYYADFQKNFNVYGFTPYLSSQKAGFSYIQDGYVDYDFLKR